MKSFLSNLLTSCLGTLLALILIILVLSAIAGSLTSLQENRPIASPNSVLKISLPDFMPEQTNNQKIQGPYIDQEDIIGIHDFEKAISEAKRDEQIKGIYLTNLNSSLGYASLSLIRKALVDFKESGKFIFAYSTFLDHKTLYLGSVGDELYLHPLGFVDLRGFNIVVPFFKELLDKLGIHYNIYYAGEFKSATEPFRLAKMSEENRLQLKEFLDGLEEQYLREISSSLNTQPDILRKNFDNFESYTSHRALEKGIINKLGYESDVYAKIRERIGIKALDDIAFVKLEQYHEQLKVKSPDYSAKNKIAVVFAEGDIIDDNGREGEIGRKYLNTFAELRKNNSIKAVVLRINSRGGSAIMSDEILEEIIKLKSEGKPVIASMGDYAASGGYYIACNADSIFSNPYTLTGSIGVFAMIPNLSKLTDQKIGIDFDTVGTGLYSNKFSLVFPWNEKESRLIQANVDNVYNRFTQVVAQGRKMDLRKVQEIARGRIYLGTRAKELGLIDEIGDLNSAIQCASRMASLDNYRIVNYPRRKGIFERLIDLLKQNNETVINMAKQVLEKDLNNFNPYWSELRYYKKSRGIQMRCPFVF